MTGPALEDHERLRPYVPRLLIEWLRDSPGARWREVEGTLAFVDISGFTKMCERLARKGKVGAEEVNDVLDSCFTRLLSVAYDDGGGVVKWGGDAVLLLFDGPEHATRACRAAVWMRQVLREIGRRLRTSAGLVSLRMSVGIHSDVFHCFLVGDLHRELIITGPGASETVAMESAATAGEILVSPSTAELVDPRAIGQRKGPGFLLRGEPAGSPPAPAPVAPDTSHLDLASCLPVAVRNHLLSGGTEAEHRLVTTAFVEFSGTDALIGEEGLEAAAVALDEVLGTVQAAVHEHDVSFFETDIGRDGGKIMLVAGAPQSSGSDEERMLRALRVVMDRDLPLGLRVGVNGGYVFAGDFGPPYRRTYSLKGDAVNLAARLMGKAGRGDILVTGQVLERSRTRFHAGQLEPFFVKGKARPVHAFRLGQIAGVKEAPRRTELPLVGREEELGRLIQSMDAARSGHGELVELIGEPGIGKSRLLEELRARAPEADVVSARCDPYESSTPYFPFRTPLREAVGIHSSDDPVEAGRRLRRSVGELAPDLLPWLPLLAIPVYAEVPPTAEVDRLDIQFKKARLEQVTGEFLSRCLAGVALFIVEDVHWIDDASADLLRHLAAFVGERSWLLCVTRREQDSRYVAPDGPDVVRIALRPLGPAAAAALVEAASHDVPLSQHAAVALADRSGGNPLFLGELIAASRDAGIEALPDTVEALLTAQIDRLSAADRTLLRYASVLGSAFDRNLLAAVLADEEARDERVWRRLEDFVSVDEHGEYRFRHALIRDVAYEGLPFKRRRDLHARAGESIECSVSEPDEQAELLSYHYFHAQRLEKAWHYSRVAGERAQSKFANVEAADFYRRALQAARGTLDVSPGEVATVSERLGDVAELAGLYDQAAGAYRSARRLVAGDLVAEAGLLMKEGVVRERSGRYAQAMGWYRRGIRSLEGAGGDGKVRAMRAQLYVWYAAARRQQGRLKECIRWCRRAIEEAEASGEREALAHAYRLLDWVYTELGAPEAELYRGKALPIYEELGDLVGASTVLNNLGIDAYFEGRWDESLDYYERSLDGCRKTGDEVNAAHAINNIAEILSDQGRLDEAEVRFREALAIWKAARFRLGTAFALSNLGRVAARSGRHDDARRLFEQAAGEFRDIGAEGQALETEARMAEDLLMAGFPDRALPLATRTLERVEALGGLAVLRAMLHRLRGYGLLEVDAGQARAAFEESLDLARSVNADYEVALTLYAMARDAERLGDPGLRQREDEARKLFERLGVVALTAVPGGAPVSA